MTETNSRLINVQINRGRPSIHNLEGPITAIYELTEENNFFSVRADLGEERSIFAKAVVAGQMIYVINSEIEPIPTDMLNVNKAEIEAAERTIALSKLTPREKELLRIR